MLTDRTFGSLVRDEKPTKDLWGILDRHPKPMTFGAIRIKLAAPQKILEIRRPRPDRLRARAPRSLGTRAPRAPALILPRHIKLSSARPGSACGLDARPRISARLYRGPLGPLQRKLPARSSYA